MPAPQQSSHLFSALDSFLHHRSHSSQSNSSGDSHGAVSASQNVGGTSDSSIPYQEFESHLTQRLSSLLATDDPCWFSLSSFNEYMGLLLATQIDLRSLIPSSQTHRRSMDEFLERSIKVLDVCRDIKEQIADVESLQDMLEIVGPCLKAKHGHSPNEGQIRRAKKILGQLLALIRVEKGDDGVHQNVDMRPSFRGRLKERLSGHYSHQEGSPQRRGSWHGHQDVTASSGHGNHSVSGGSSHSSLSGSASGSSTQASDVQRALQSLELSLLPPKLTVRDEEECFACAIYALNVMSVFFLGTMTAAFPSLSIKSHVIGAIHPPNSFRWAAAFLHVQDKVQEDLRVRSRRRAVHAGLWELDALFCLIKRLLELATSESLPWSADIQEEVRRLVSQFDEHMYELRTQLVNFYKQITDFYNRIISARSEVYYTLSSFSVT